MHTNIDSMHARFIDLGSCGKYSACELNEVDSRRFQQSATTAVADFLTLCRLRREGSPERSRAEGLFVFLEKLRRVTGLFLIITRRGC